MKLPKDVFIVEIDADKRTWVEKVRDQFDKAQLNALNRCICENMITAIKNECVNRHDLPTEDEAQAFELLLGFYAQLFRNVRI